MANGKISTGFVSGVGTHLTASNRTDTSVEGVLFDELSTNTRSSLVVVRPGYSMLLSAYSASEDSDYQIKLFKVKRAVFDIPVLDKAGGCCIPVALEDNDRILYRAPYKPLGVQVALSKDADIGYVAMPGVYQLEITDELYLNDVFVEFAIMPSNQMLPKYTLGG